MAFQQDLKDGQFGQKVALSYLKCIYGDLYDYVETVGKNENFDICITESHERDGQGMPYGGDIVKTWEIKYDIMSAKTGNLCFELSNDKRKTALLASGADEIIYVLPTSEKDKYQLFIFGTRHLINELFLMSLEKNKALRIVKGGDNNRFTLALISIENTINILKPETQIIEFKGKNGKKSKIKKRM